MGHSKRDLQVAKTEWHRRHGRLDVHKLRFVLASVDLLASVRGRRYDFVHSLGALQHVPPPLQGAFLEQLCDVLMPGGTGWLQIPIWTPPEERNGGLTAEAGEESGTDCAMSQKRSRPAGTAFELPLGVAGGRAAEGVDGMPIWSTPPEHIAQILRSRGVCATQLTHSIHHTAYTQHAYNIHTACTQHTQSIHVHTAYTPNTGP